MSRGQGGEKRVFYLNLFIPLTIACTLFIAACTLLPAAWASSVTHEEVEAIAKKLRCPVCQNLSVADSDSVVSNQIRTKIRKMLEDGRTEQQVMDYFVSKYGEWILLSPPKHGFNWLVWAGPFAAVLIGGFLLLRFLKKSQTPPSEGPSTPDTA